MVVARPAYDQFFALMSVSTQKYNGYDLHNILLIAPTKRFSYELAFRAAKIIKFNKPLTFIHFMFDFFFLRKLFCSRLNATLPPFKSPRCPISLNISSAKVVV